MPEDEDFTEERYKRAEELAKQWRAEGLVNPDRNEGEIVALAFDHVLCSDKLLEALPHIYEGRPDLLDQAATLALMQDNYRGMKTADDTGFSPEEKAQHRRRIEAGKDVLDQCRKQVWEMITKRFESSG